MGVQSYKELIVWQKSLDLVKKIYLLTNKLPKNEAFGLASQVQRSAVSIPSNIAEGQQRNGRAEFNQFIGIARGSAAELETQLIIMEQVYNLDVRSELLQLTEVQKMLSAFSAKLKK